MRRIRFISPFGSVVYDAIIETTLGQYEAHSTEMVVTHLSAVKLTGIGTLTATFRDIDPVPAAVPLPHAG